MRPKDWMTFNAVPCHCIILEMIDSGISVTLNGPRVGLENGWMDGYAKHPSTFTHFLLAKGKASVLLIMGRNEGSLNSLTGINHRSSLTLQQKFWVKQNPLQNARMFVRSIWNLFLCRLIKRNKFLFHFLLWRCLICWRSITTHRMRTQSIGWSLFFFFFVSYISIWSCCRKLPQLNSSAAGVSDSNEHIHKNSEICPLSLPVPSPDERRFSKKIPSAAIYGWTWLPLVSAKLLSGSFKRLNEWWKQWF